MKKKVIYFPLFLLVMVYAVSFSGCSRLAGPSDAEAIKAIVESTSFSEEYGGLRIQEPIVVLEKSNHKNQNSVWTVKIKFSYLVNKEQRTVPEEQIRTFTLREAKDRAGRSVWKAALAK